MPPKTAFNVKALTMPLAAFTMATLLFVYTRTSIQAAKRNAQRHREADGGQISWRNESLRRHGALDGPAGGTGQGESVRGTVRELMGTLKGGEDADVDEKGKGNGKRNGNGETEEERRIRERKRGL
ncbi:hypothetical protein PZA11_007809 [Diplocarpon coronariae]|uniref:Uncharacterized protein n=1 Tax=Diplocarpon coronariae TaxID=2795749 RepID=A0A218ZEN0_9HELO|nr:hypothetical protein JHW43_003160 [Diplocarpon mali]OWP05993.1 hypothetical protein B2J93_6317 [Marssonina coronariae]